MTRRVRYTTREDLERLFQAITGGEHFTLRIDPESQADFGTTSQTGYETFVEGNWAAAGESLKVCACGHSREQHAPARPPRLRPAQCRVPGCRCLGWSARHVLEGRCTHVED